jgi:UDP-glucose 4-epimerase
VEPFTKSINKFREKVQACYPVMILQDNQDAVNVFFSRHDYQSEIVNYPILYLENNVNATQILLEQMDFHDVRYMVYSSTAAPKEMLQMG